MNSRRIDETYRLQLGDLVRIPPIRVASGPGEARSACARISDPLRGRRAAGGEQTGRCGGAWRQRSQLRRDRADAQRAPAGQVPRTGAPAGPRDLRRAAAGEEAFRADRDARDHARGQQRQALSRAGAGAMEERQAARQAAAAQVRHAARREARDGARRRAGLAYHLRAAERAGRISPCWKHSSRPGAPTRSACISRTSAFRSPATTSTAISSGTRAWRSRA